MAKNRYIGEYPVIGIRPIIDGRPAPMTLGFDRILAMGVSGVMLASPFARPVWS